MAYNRERRVCFRTCDDAGTNIELALPVRSALRDLRFWLPGFWRLRFSGLWRCDDGHKNCRNVGNFWHFSLADTDLYSRRHQSSRRAFWRLRSSGLWRCDDGHKNCRNVGNFWHFSLANTDLYSRGINLLGELCYFYLCYIYIKTLAIFKVVWSRRKVTDCLKNTGVIVMTVENSSAQKSCLLVPPSATNLTWPYFVLNPGIRGRKPSTYSLVKRALFIYLF
jgi:hypothetical protein